MGENGETLYEGDFRAQLWRTYHNITGLLESEDATWQDIVRTTCYIRDIERDYAEFNEVRNEFFHALGLDPFPASTAIQARICRSDLLVEIEADRDPRARRREMSRSRQSPLIRGRLAAPLGGLALLCGGVRSQPPPPTGARCPDRRHPSAAPRPALPRLRKPVSLVRADWFDGARLVRRFP